MENIIDNNITGINVGKIQNNNNTHANNFTIFHIILHITKITSEGIIIGNTNIIKITGNMPNGLSRETLIWL